MPGIEIVCRITEKKWLTPTVMGIRFEPSKKFKYEPGQFISLRVPHPQGHRKQYRRVYSFASPDAEYGYELCVKYVPDGPGSTYLKSLDVGEFFRATAPYGDFLFQSNPERQVCFIATGTGVAPFRGMALSKRFQENTPRNTTLLFGARNEDEIFYQESFQRAGVETVFALSRPSATWGGFRGRVTDYLKSLPADWGWHSTDFYLCGNGEMVVEAVEILRNRGVPDRAIHKEVYFAPSISRAA